MEEKNKNNKWKTEEYSCDYREGHRKEALFSIMESVIDNLRNCGDVTEEEIEREFEVYMS